jgi:hypothetical protein
VVNDSDNNYFRKFHCPKRSLIGVGVALKVVAVSNCFFKSSKDSILNKEDKEVAVMEYLPYCFFSRVLQEFPNLQGK